MSAMTKTARFMCRVMATVGNLLSPVDLSRLCALLDRVEATTRINQLRAAHDALVVKVNELKTAGAAS